MKKINYDTIIGCIIVTFFLIIFAYDCINTIQYQVLAYDEAYNASVAANVMRYGEYRVSYPSDITFNNIITTGETVILPTALIYKVCGINTVTSSIVATIYGMGCILILFLLIKNCIKYFTDKSSIISAVCTVLLVLSDGLFIYVSTHLIGEVAALFFVLTGFVFIEKFYRSGKKKFILGAGAFFAFSFLTKSSMIFIVVSILGLIIAEVFLLKTITIKDTLVFACGFISGFALLDSYKFYQLGGIFPYLNWWSDEWKNMISQSSGADISYSVFEKIDYLSEIFAGCNDWLCILVTVLPVFIWTILILNAHKTNRTFSIENNGLKVMTLGGVCGASLIVYFVLLGGSGLVYARRHEVNEFLVRVYAVFFAVVILCKAKNIIKNNTIHAAIIICVAIALLFSVIPLNVVKNNCSLYASKECENTYSAELMNQFLDEVDKLPEDAVLYCAGWWQEPDISLFLDRDMISIYDVIYSDAVLAEKSYFISGNYINDVSIADIEDSLNVHMVKVDTSEVDYEKFVTQFDRKDIDNFAIYRLVQSKPEISLINEANNLSFTVANDNGHDYIHYGFSNAEEGFTWTDGKEAEIWFHISSPSIRLLHIKIDIGAVFNSEQYITVVCNENQCFSGNIREDSSVIEFDVLSDENGDVSMKFEIPQAESPSNLGMNEDSRILGIGIKSIVISEK